MKLTPHNKYPKLKKHEVWKRLKLKKNTAWLEGSMIADFGIYELIKCYQDCYCTEEGYDFEVTQVIRVTGEAILRMMCKIP